MSGAEWNEMVAKCEANAPDDSEIDFSDIPEANSFDNWYYGNPEHIPVRLVREGQARYRVERVDGKDESPFVHRGPPDALAAYDASNR